MKPSGLISMKNYRLPLREFVWVHVLVSLYLDLRYRESGTLREVGKRGGFWMKSCHCFVFKAKKIKVFLLKIFRSRGVELKTRALAPRVCSGRCRQLMLRGSIRDAPTSSFDSVCSVLTSLAFSFSDHEMERITPVLPLLLIEPWLYVRVEKSDCADFMQHFRR